MEEEATQTSTLSLSQQGEMASSSLPVLLATPLPGLDGTEQDRTAVRLFWTSDCMRSRDLRRTISELADPDEVALLVMRADASGKMLSAQAVRSVRARARSRMISLLNKLIESERREIDRLSLIVAGVEWPGLRHNFYQRALNHVHDMHLPWPEEDVLPVSWLPGATTVEENLTMSEAELRVAADALRHDLARLADVLPKFKAMALLDSDDHLLQIVLSWLGASALQRALANLQAVAPLEVGNERRKKSFL